MAVFTGYTEQNSSQMPRVCLGGGVWVVLELTGILTAVSNTPPPRSDIGSLPFQEGKLLSPTFFKLSSPL